MIGRLIIRRNFLRVGLLNSSLSFRTLPKITNTSKVFLIGASYPVFKDLSKEEMENFDLKLKEACEHGETAIVELMNVLQKKITDISHAYKDCLNKQITLVEEATKAGPSSQKWDDLPQFRTQAAEMNQQFQNLIATINTLDGIAQNEALKYITEQEKQFQLLGRKHKELEKIITKQVQEIKNLEDKLLKKNRDSIEKTK